MKKLFVLFSVLVLALLVMSACAPKVGPQGPQGEIGPMGPQGPQGLAGEDGFDGEDADPADVLALIQSDPAFIKAVAEQVMAQPIATVESADIEPTEEPTVIADPFEGLSACPYKDTGSPQPEKLDVSTLKLPDGRTVYALDLSKLLGCAIAFEGRFPWQTAYPALSALLSQGNITDNGSAWDPWNVHFIVDVRSVMGNFDPTSYNKLVNVPDQYKNWFVYSEGSFWFYDPNWNMSNLKTAKPSIAQELEAKKFRDAMVPGNYNYPRVIVQPSGTMFAFWQTDSGDVAYNNGISAGCTASDQPELIPVYGLYDGKQFSAAIGAGNCRMAYWADNSQTPVIWHGYQKDGKEIVNYQTSVIAYMFPANWSEDQVNTWIEDHPFGK